MVPPPERLRAGQLWADTGFVFDDIGEPCEPRNALRALKVAATAAGLPKVGLLHTLRHSAASAMLSNGVPITVVSQILGHSGISITVDVYGHVSPEVSREALDVLAAAFSRSGESQGDLSGDLAEKRPFRGRTPGQ